MQKRVFTVVFILLVLTGLMLAQVSRPAVPQAPPPSTPQSPVIKVSVTVVQVDTVVTDSKGKIVSDLKPEDFELLENGKPQKITNFSYVSVGTLPEKPAVKPIDKKAPPVPPVKLRPDQVRRTIALVVDDLGLSFEDMVYTRDSLKKFVNEQMQPGDLVAILLTGKGIGALQQFTADKRRLLMAIDRLKWNPFGRSNPIGLPPTDNSQQDPNIPTVPLKDTLGPLHQDIFAVGTLGAIDFVVQGLRDIPGRKSIILFSNGFQVKEKNTSADGTQELPSTSNPRIMDGLKRTIEAANQASVVIYTVDPRGLQTLSLTAADNVTPANAASVAQTRSSDFLETQDSLGYLANETGGLFFGNNNDLNLGIRRALEDQKGYYLIGYSPDEASLGSDPKKSKFHKITVKVNRPGLHVRYRSGFYPLNEEIAKTTPATLGQKMVAAVNSPFAAGGVHLRLTSLFGNNPKTGSVLRSLLYIDPKDLTFAPEKDGTHLAEVDVLAVTYGENGPVGEPLAKTYSIKLGEKSYQRSIKNGFVYTLDVPVKKGGPYQLRVALRDSATGRVGTANQFIEVPDMSKKRLALSGIAVSGEYPSSTGKTPQQPAANAPVPPGEATALAAEPQGDPLSSPAARMFKRGMFLNFVTQIYNAKLDGSSRQPKLQMQMRMFREGKLIYDKEGLLDVGQQKDPQRPLVGGRLQLGSQMEPGEYVLQVVVVDKLAKEKYNMATQWIDFDVVE